MVHSVLVAKGTASTAPGDSQAKSLHLRKEAYRSSEPNVGELAREFSARSQLARRNTPVRIPVDVNPGARPNRFAVIPEVSAVQLGMGAVALAVAEFRLKDLGQLV